MGGSEHLVVAPVLLPLAGAATMLLVAERHRRAKALLNLACTALGLALAVALLLQVGAGGPAAVYLPGNWVAPFGIALVADRLSALMAVLAGSVALAALVFALARWHQAGSYFHALFQFQLMGLYGAFLTADLFNLFVFFEVLLAASYGLLLHGGGPERVRAGLHYIAINLVASLLFLIGVALLYGVTGTLNMADIALALPTVPESDRGLLHAGAAILAIAFLAKAALWPMAFWLPAAYAAASAPAAAVFAILTKVGVYAVLRLWTLCFAAPAGVSAGFGDRVLVWGGIATLAYGAIGMLASQRAVRFAGYSVIASSGTLIAAVGLDAAALGAAALYYLASSTLAACTLYLLVELLERSREAEFAPPEPAVRGGALPAFDAAPAPAGVNLDDDEKALVGRALPGAMAFLGVAFALCAMVVAGLPPLAGFVAKLGMLAALLESPGAASWTLFALLLASGMAAAIALLRIGVRHFWTDRPAPRLHAAETLPIAGLLAASVALALQADAVLRYARDTADALHDPARYTQAVWAARPLPQPSMELGR